MFLTGRCKYNNVIKNVFNYVRAKINLPDKMLDVDVVEKVIAKICSVFKDNVFYNLDAEECTKTLRTLFAQ
jgi:hypothetical protein